MTTQENLYPKIQSIIKEKGLLRKQPLYYIWKIGSTLGMLAVSLTFLVLVNNFWLQLANAAFLAFVFGQIGFIGHDAGHRNIARSAWMNEIIGLGAAFFINLSRSWWIKQHNQHHATPNDLEKDPHTALPLLAFSPEAASKKKGMLRCIVGYQAFYFIPFLLLEGFGLRLASIQFLAKRKDVKYPLIEPLLMTLHFILYFGMLFYVFNLWQVLAFTLVHQGLFGLYYGTVFAPNHKGMLIVGKNNPLDFLLWQVLTARNIKPNFFADFWYGGLNYQIEHHLFPNAPRNQLRKIQNIVQQFCQQNEIPYRETSMIQAWREILTSLHQDTACLRSNGKKSLQQESIT